VTSAQVNRTSYAVLLEATIYREPPRSNNRHRRARRFWTADAGPVGSWSAADIARWRRRRTGNGRDLGRDHAGGAHGVAEEGPGIRFGGRRNGEL